jgi:hypothetical protein
MQHLSGCQYPATGEFHVRRCPQPTQILKRAACGSRRRRVQRRRRRDLGELRRPSDRKSARSRPGVAPRGLAESASSRMESCGVAAPQRPQARKISPWGGTSRYWRDQRRHGWNLGELRRPSDRKPARSRPGVAPRGFRRDQRRRGWNLVELRRPRDRKHSRSPCRRLANLENAGYWEHPPRSWTARTPRPLESRRHRVRCHRARDLAELWRPAARSHGYPRELEELRVVSNRVSSRSVRVGWLPTNIDCQQTLTARLLWRGRRCAGAAGDVLSCNPGRCCGRLR